MDARLKDGFIHLVVEADTKQQLPLASGMLCLAGGAKAY